MYRNKVACFYMSVAIVHNNYVMIEEKHSSLLFFVWSCLDATDMLFLVAG